MLLHMRLTKLESLVERLLYEQSPVKRKKLAQNIAEFGEDAIDPLLRAIDLKWETMDIETDLFICDALSYTYKKTGLHPFERILMDKTYSFRNYLPKMLASFKEDEVTVLMDKALQNETEARFQTELIVGLGKTDSKQAIQILQQYVTHKDLEVSFLAEFWIAMIERKKLPPVPAGLEW